MAEEAVVAPEEEATAEVVDNPQVQEDQAKPGPEGEEATTEQPEGTEEAPKEKSRHQRRKEAMARMRESVEEAEERARRAEARIKQIEEATGSVELPKEADFASYEEYQAALSGHYALKQLDQRETQRVQSEKQEVDAEVSRVRQEQEYEAAQAWAADVADAKTRYADFEQVAFTAPISDGVAYLVRDMEQAADVAYHLGKNHDIAAELNKLPPTQAAYELGRIEANLSRPAPAPTTQAPDPITPVRPKASATLDPSKMSMAEYAAARKAGKI